VRKAGFRDQKADRVVNMLMQKTASSNQKGTYGPLGYVRFGASKNSSFE
jgi:hypothetical protein